MKERLKIGFILLGLAFLSSCSKKQTVVPNTPTVEPELAGVDISEQFYINKAGVQFYDSFGKPLSILHFLKENGVNTIRLRTWVGAGVKYSLKDMFEFSKECKLAGFKIWLDLHYSNTWADPGNQSIPQEWKNTSLATLKDSVFQYTRWACEVIQPDYIQIGNEINNGLLWPKGAASDTAGFYSLIRAGISGAKSYDTSLPVILHYAGYQGSVDFFRKLNWHGIHPELAGLSYYPLWHGRNLDSLQQNMYTISSENHCRCIIAETSYPFTLGWNDYTNNPLGDSSQILKPYLPTPQGQYGFCRKLKTVAYLSGAVSGICYWEPTWVAYKGKTSTDGSPWENQTWFDFNNRSLPVSRLFTP